MAKLTLSNVLSGYTATETINANNDAIVTAFDNTISRDGTTPNAMAAQLDMGSNRIINVAHPQASNDAIRLADLIAASTPLFTTTADWTTQVINKPATFPSSAHTHVKADITDLAVGSILPGTIVADAGPAWATNYHVYSTFTSNMGAFPITSRFGNNSVSIAEALAGVIDIPATDVGGNAGMGVAGYGRCSGPGKGAVGIFGAGLTNGASASVWGANTLTTNANQCQGATQTGFNNFTGWGLELDFNIKKLPGGAAPNMALRGIHLIGDSETGPSGGINAKFAAIDIDSPGINMVPKLKWNHGLTTADGACTYAVNIGTTAVGNTVGSQPILMNGRNSTGVAKQASIQMDPDGNVVWAAATGGGHNFQDGGTVDAQILPGGIVRSGASYQVGLDQVIHQRHTLWGIPTGTATTTTFNTATVTTQQLAERVMALIIALHANAGGHGLIGT